MIRRLYRDIGAYGRFALWVFLALIGIFAVLNFMTNRFPAPVSTAASKAASLARGNTTVLGG